jgi:hypothetical protein
VIGGTVATARSCVFRGLLCGSLTSLTRIAAISGPEGLPNSLRTTPRRLAEWTALERGSLIRHAT